MKKYKESELYQQFIALFRNKYFYIGGATLIFGAQLTFHFQAYLLSLVESGYHLPELSDIILDNIPYRDIDVLYDVGSLLSTLALFAFFIHKKKLYKLPYTFMLMGIFHIIRGIFIVLTPLGNPPGFNGTDGIFNGFSEIELGVYPSGHTGITFLFLLLVKEKPYRQILIFSVLLIIVTLFISRGHYSIDVLSGIFFAYAIKSFGDKHFRKYFDPITQKEELEALQQQAL